MNKILVCPIAFNERPKIKTVINRYLASPVKDQTDYLILDDASNDGTTDIIQSYADHGVRIIKHPNRQGVGAAIRTAIQYARQSSYEALVIMAGNDKDNPDEIPRLIEPILKDGYDFIQGSRYKLTQGVGGDMPYYRKIATRLHPWFMSLITGHRVTDSTNGFRAFRLPVFDDQRINLNQDWLDNYELEPYLLYKVITLGYKFKEVGVTKIYPSKKLGYTKMRPITGWWSILRPLFYLWLGFKK